MKFGKGFTVRLPICTRAAGGVSAALGFMVLTGWHTHTSILIQTHPALVPMQYNTATGFLSGALMLLAFSQQHR